MIKVHIKNLQNKSVVSCTFHVTTSLVLKEYTNFPKTDERTFRWFKPNQQQKQMWGKNTFAK